METKQSSGEEVDKTLFTVQTEDGDRPPAAGQNNMPSGYRDNKSEKLLLDQQQRDGTSHVKV